MTAVSQAGVAATVAAPLSVTGCSTLPYAPTLAVSEAIDGKDNGATVGLAVAQAANEAATKTIAFKLPSDLAVNAAADATCLTGAGTGCVVGTATATSPLTPLKLTGTVTLAGSQTSPTVTVSFPAPFAITVVGDVNSAARTITINNVPDVPLTHLTLTITGAHGHKAFTTNCAPSSATGTFTSQSGVTKSVSAKVALTHCVAGPTASGSVRRLATGHPNLRITAVQGQGAARTASLAVGLPAGLKFARVGIASSKGLGVSGASVRSVALKGGKLVVLLKRAARTVTIQMSGPILTETTSLAGSVKKHKVKSIMVTLRVTDIKHTTRSVPLALRAH